MVGSPIRPGTPQGGHSTAPGGRGGGEDQQVCISTLRSTKKVIKSLKKRSQIKKKILAKKVRVAAMFVVTSCILMMTSRGIFPWGNPNFNFQYTLVYSLDIWMDATFLILIFSLG